MNYQPDWSCAILADRGTCPLHSFVALGLYSVVGFEGRAARAVASFAVEPGMGCSAASRLCSPGLPAPWAACTLVRDTATLHVPVSP